MIQVIGEKMLITDISQNETMDGSIGEQNATRSDAIFMESNTTHILADSLRVYGSILASGFLLYCILRKRYPRTFAVRQWVSEHKTPLAGDQFGYFSWIWKVYSFNETELLESIALDALCFLRLMMMGLRLSVLGCLNSIWLFPVYTSASDSRFRDDPVTGSTINSLPKYSPRFSATVIAAYIFFGYTMYTIIVEFRWFIGQRHKWLKQFNARNYTILVRNIPSILRSDAVLKEHYKHLYGLDRVLESHVCIHMTSLQPLLKRRKMCIRNLEHALAKAPSNQTRTQSWYKTHCFFSFFSYLNQKENLDAIDNLKEELNMLNKDINDLINVIERKQRPTFTGGKQKGSRTLTQGMNSSSANCSVVDILEDDSDNALSRVSEHTPEKSLRCRRTVDIDQRDASESRRSLMIMSSPSLMHTKSAIKQRAVKGITQVREKVKLTNEILISFITSEEDGTADDAAFVTFKSLVATYCALQMSQHRKPFILETIPAPDNPQHIFWNNMGKPEELLQMGRYLSCGITVVICAFWTLVVTLIVGLANVDYLKGNPWLDWIRVLISPLILLLFNSGLLPIILKAVSRLECPASDSLLETSAFWKMAAFTIIQTFFVSLISGSIVQEFEKYVSNPREILRFLALALPGRSGYFMQLLIVSTCLGTLIELFRVVAIFQSIARANFGRRLTEKQRSRTVGILRPLSCVDKIYFSRMQSRFLLYFMVMFVYTTISPLVNWLCMILFVFVGSVYRYQFVFNYPKTPDSGGKIWLHFMRTMFACILIAQLALLSFLALRGSEIAAICMIPLLIVTCIFISHVNEYYFKLGEFLPAKECLSQDMANDDDGMDYNEFMNSYKNPSLMARFEDVNWMPNQSSSPKLDKDESEESIRLDVSGDNI